MSLPTTPDTICAPSDDVVAREIEGEIVIVPLTAGIGDADARPAAPRTDSVRVKPPAALPKIELVAKSEAPVAAQRPPTTPAPAVAPPRPQQPPPASAGGTVVGSYALRENANALRDYYRGQKIRAEVEQAMINGRQMYRVRIWR